MRPTPKGTDILVLYIGISAMILLLIGVVSEPASLLQRSLFVIGALMLTLCAYLGRQGTLFVLEIVISLGSMFAFLAISDVVKYAVLLGAALVGIIYLRLTKKYDSGAWGIVSSAGLLLVGAGFATDATAHPLYFGLLLGVGSLVIALYSFVDYYYDKHDVAAIWVVLNIIFAINPLLMALKALRGY